MTMLSSLQTKLTASFVALILSVTLLTFLITFTATRDALREITQEELLAVAAVAATQLNGEMAGRMAALSPGEESTEEFENLRSRLAHIRDAHSDIIYVYTMRRTPAGVEFVVDADYGNPDDPGAAIGEAYDETTPQLLQGFDEPAVDEEFSTDAWGTFLSGYAPIYDADGQPVGLLGIDMSKQRVIEKQDFISKSIYLVMAAGIVLAGLFILLFSKTIIKDVRHLNEVANRISMGDMEVEIAVRRTDEIGELADSFGRMVASLKLMMVLGKDD